MNRTAPAACLLAFLSASVMAGDTGLSRFLPREASLPGWTSAGSASEFRGEELYDHIDGGAEIFMEFGFRAALARDYFDPGGRGFVLEIYEMEDAAAAYGMFTWFQAPGGQSLSLGDGAQLSDYYLSFRKGRFLVNVTAGAEHREAAASLRILAGAVEARLPGGERIPRLAELPAVAGRIPGSVDYFEGGLGFLNSLPFFGGDVFHVRRGVKAAYEGGYEIFILEFSGPGESRENLEAARKQLEAKGIFRLENQPDDMGFRLAKEDGGTAEISAVGGTILGGMCLRPGPEAEASLAASLEETRRALESAEPPGDGTDRPAKAWRAGFSGMSRYETWDNVRTLDAEPHLGRAAVLVQARLSLEGAAAPGLDFEMGLVHEARWTIAPSGESFRWDEAVFDRLLLRWSRPAGLPLTFTLGRQPLFFGEGFLVAEGTPLDETRSDYFNAVSLEWTPGRAGKLSFFACHQPTRDSFLPVINSRDRPLVEQPETGAGLVFRRERDGSEWEASLIYKKAAAGSVPLPRAEVLALDGRAVWKPVSGIALSGEAAFQSGKKGGAVLTAWGANAGIAWEAPRSLRIPLRLSAGALYLSGDDPASGREEGWIPLFSRWPRWSESYIYALAEEYGGLTAWWSNLALLHGDLEVKPAAKLILRLAARHMAAPQAGPVSWGMISGEGHIRGDLWSASVIFLLSPRLKGRLLYEGFRPGNFYIPQADGYSFLRVELLWAL